MPTMYAWKCRRCGFVKDTLEQAAGPCPQCGDSLRRDYHFNTPGPNNFGDRAHFNWSLGQPVHNDRDFRTKLHRKSDEMAERLGIDCNYQPHEHGDRIGVTDDE